MPNYVKNKIAITGSFDQLNALIEKFGTYHKAQIRKSHDNLLICNDKKDPWGVYWLDLKTGIGSSRKEWNQPGLPDGVEPEIKDGFLAFPDFKKIVPPPDDLAYEDKPNQEVARVSSNWWYTWNVNNWGVKWPGNDYQREGINIFTFETAWSNVSGLICKMSEIFPEITFKYSYADEDTGFNCSKMIIIGGVIIEEDKPDGGTKEAYELAFSLSPEKKNNYSLVGNEYVYNEED